MKSLKFIGCILLFWTQLHAQHTLESSDLPVVSIDTKGQEIQDEPKIMARMGISFQADGKPNTPDGPFNIYDGWIGIELRGSSSQLFDKLQYGVETRFEDGSNRNVSLLGLPKENDWILYAPFADRSPVRNVLTYQLAREMGHYATRTRYCELVLNGSYQGVYVLMEKIKRDSARVNIRKLGKSDTTGVDLTGGYILKLDKATGNFRGGWLSDYTNSLGFGVFFQYEYPEGDELHPKQKAYIQQYMREFEDAIFGEDFKNPLTGYRAYIDVPSFIDYLILNEVSKNIDAYRFSTFMYKERGEKLKMGPVWDYNFAWANAGYNDDARFDGLIAGTIEPDYWNTPGHPLWWKQLLKDAWFRDQLRCRWEALRPNVLNLNHILDIVDSCITHLGPALERDYIRWEVPRRLHLPDVKSSLQHEYKVLTNWIVGRMKWLEQGIPGVCREEPKQNYLPSPNPFIEYVHLPFHVSKGSRVNGQILDFQGRLVLPFLKNKYFSEGNYQYIWDGVGLNGKQMEKGLYLVQFQIGDSHSVTHKIVKE